MIALLLGLACPGWCVRCCWHGRGGGVAVVEQHPLPAPVVRGFTRGGHYFDTGFHYAGGLGEGGGFAPLLGYLGLADELELVPYDVTGFDSVRLMDSGETLAMPVGYARIEAALHQRFPPTKRRKLLPISGSFKRTGVTFLISLQMCRLGHLQHRQCMVKLWRSALQKFAAYPELQSLLSMHCLLYGVTPDVAPLPLNMQVAGSYYHSVHGIKGGGRALVDSLLGLLEAAGVEVVLCGQGVKAINVAAQGVTGVTLAAGQQLSGQEVVATCNPATVPLLLPEGGGAAGLP